jgi:hypothetical protein
MQSRNSTLRRQPLKRKAVTLFAFCSARVAAERGSAKNERAFCWRG